MAHSYSRFAYHLVWATKNREALIDSQTEDFLLGYVPNKIREMKGKYDICNMVEDHIHLLCEIPTSLSVSEFLRQLKGGSSYAINDEPFSHGSFEWQRGYGGFTVYEKNKHVVEKYIRMQKVHHADPLFDHPWEKIDIGV